MSFQTIQTDLIGFIENVESLDIQEVKEKLTFLRENLRKLEDETEENKLFFSAVDSAFPDIIYLFNISTQIIIYANNSLENVLGYKIPEIYNTKETIIDFLIHSDDKNAVLKHVEKMLLTKDGEVLENSFRIKHISGDYIWFKNKNVIFERDKNNYPNILFGVSHNISQEKRMELVLRKSEERYRTFFKESPLGIYRTSPDGKLLDANPTLVKMLGFESEQELKIERNSILVGYVTPSERENFISQIEAKGEVVDFESEWKDKLGKSIWVRERAKIITDINNQILYYEGVVEDISERKTVEDELRKLKKAVESSRASVVVTNFDGIIEYVNPYFCEMTGYSVEEAIGQKPNILKSGRQEKEIYDSLWENIRKGETWEGEFCNRKKNGEEYWEHATISPIKNFQGKITHFVAVKINISERKNIENKLKWELAVNSALSELYIPLIDEKKGIKEISDIILKHSLSLTESKYGYVGTIDPETRNLLSHTLSKMMEQDCNLENKCAVFAVDNMGKYPSLWGFSLNTKKPFFTNEPNSHPFSKGIPKGHVVLENFLSVPVLLGDEVVGQIALSNSKRNYDSQDIEAIRLIAEYFALAIQRLRKEAELKRFNENLQELNATKDKFFSIIAHDLKNPFNVLIGFSDLIVKNADFYEKSRIKQFAEMIHNGAKQGYDLLENLLTWSKSQRNKIAFNPEKVNLKIIILNNFALLSEIAFSKNISLINEVEKEMLVNVDRNMIYTVLRNLISNALKFTQNGGKVIVSVKEIDQKVEVCVADSGVGIEKSLIPKLFRIDENFSTAGTSGEKGTGLGLILCKEFIEKHGEKIFVESELNKGSKFIFTLPKF